MVNMGDMTNTMKLNDALEASACANWEEGNFISKLYTLFSATLFDCCQFAYTVSHTYTFRIQLTLCIVVGWFFACTHQTQIEQNSKLSNINIKPSDINMMRWHINKNNRKRYNSFDVRVFVGLIQFGDEIDDIIM